MFHNNGGIELHFCRAKMVKDFVRETAQTAYHKELANLLLRANTASVNVHYISRFPGTSPVAREGEE